MYRKAENIVVVEKQTYSGNEQHLCVYYISEWNARGRKIVIIFGCQYFAIKLNESDKW